MAVSVVDVRRGFVRSSLPSGVLRFPAASASLLYVEDAVAVDAADVKANAQAGMAEAVFFSFTNLQQVRACNRGDREGERLCDSPARYDSDSMRDCRWQNLATFCSMMFA